jgi:hypothetical protein
MLSEELIKQIFFQSDRPRRDALLADEVDIVQFAENVIAVARHEIVKQEHARCVAIVKDMNRAVGEALENQRPR